MKNRKEYIILLVVIVLISAYLLVQKKGELHYSLPEIKEIDKHSITGLKVTKGGSELSITKENDRWLILPQKYPADKSQVDNMIDAVENVKLTALASESKNYAIYELDEENMIKVELEGKDGILRELYIGKPASSYRHTFVRLGNNHRVYHAEGNLKNIFNKTADNLRDKVVLAFNEEINEITLTKDKKNIIIVRASAPVSQEPGSGQETPIKWQTDEGGPVNEQDVDEIIETLRNLRCEGFVKDKTKEDFASPVYTVSLKGLKTYSISFFEKQDTKFPAFSSENEYPFFVSEWKAKKIMKDPDTLSQKEK